MKTIYSLLFVLAIYPWTNANSQVSVTTEIQASVAAEESLPVLGTRYYYYPNLDTYFDTQENLYIFEQQGQWVKSKDLKSGYRGYSIFNNVRVAITDYDGDRPFTKLDEHRKQFPKNYSSKRKPPKVIPNDSKVAFK